jgi:putative transposase
MHHATAYHAWAKGDIERFFGTLENIWIKETPGWCGNSPKERPETFAKDLKRMIGQGTLWTMDELFVYLRDTAFPEYHNRPHSGNGNKAPLELYSTLPRARGEEPDWALLSVARQHKEQRKIRPDGIHFANNIYWHDNMIGLAGQYVTILFEKSNLSTVSVILPDNHFLCEATIKERIAMVDADQEQLEMHLTMQHKQKRDVKERVRHATRSVFADEVDASRAGGNLSSMEYTKASRARKEARRRLETEKQALREPANDPVRKFFHASGAELWRNG